MSPPKPKQSLANDASAEYSFRDEGNQSSVGSPRQEILTGGMQTSVENTVTSNILPISTTTATIATIKEHNAAAD